MSWIVAACVAHGYVVAKMFISATSFMSRATILAF